MIIKRYRAKTIKLIHIKENYGGNFMYMFLCLKCKCVDNGDKVAHTEMLILN